MARMAPTRRSRPAGKSPVGIETKSQQRRLKTCGRCGELFRAPAVGEDAACSACLDSERTRAAEAVAAAAARRERRNRVAAGLLLTGGLVMLGSGVRRAMSGPSAPATLTTEAAPRSEADRNVRLAIDSQPADAIVWIDGEPVGRTPLRLEVAPEKLAALPVRVSREGFTAAEQLLAASALDRTVEWRAVLTPLSNEAEARTGGLAAESMIASNVAFGGRAAGGDPGNAPRAARDGEGASDAGAPGRAGWEPRQAATSVVEWPTVQLSAECVGFRVHVTRANAALLPAVRDYLKHRIGQLSESQTFSLCFVEGAESVCLGPTPTRAVLGEKLRAYDFVDAIRAADPGRGGLPPIDPAAREVLVLADTMPPETGAAVADAADGRPRVHWIALGDSRPTPVLPAWVRVYQATPAAAQPAMQTALGRAVEDEE